MAVQQCRFYQNISPTDSSYIDVTWLDTWYFVQLIQWYSLQLFQCSHGSKYPNTLPQVGRKSWTASRRKYSSWRGQAGDRVGRVGACSVFLFNALSQCTPAKHLDLMFQSVMSAVWGSVCLPESTSVKSVLVQRFVFKNVSVSKCHPIICGCQLPGLQLQQQLASRRT